MFYIFEPTKTKKMNKTLSLLAISALLLGTAASCKKKGCTDPSAVNYSTEAKKDDGSCKFAQPLLSMAIILKQLMLETLTMMLALLQQILMAQLPL